MDDRSIQCSHWEECGGFGNGCCRAGKYYRPTFEVCLTKCTAYDGPPRGAGDLLAKAIKKVTNGKVTPCGGCEERMLDFNRAIPFSQG